MQQPTIEQILAMPEGQELDALVHRIALNRPGKPRAYSTKPDVAIDLIVHLPIGVSRLSPQSPGYKPERPFVAMILERTPQLNYATQSSVSAKTIALALSKMALLFVLAPRTQAPVQPGQRRTVVAPGIPKIGSSLQPRKLEALPPRVMAARIPDLPTPTAEPPKTE